MPIRTLLQRSTRFPRLGVIRLGVKVQGTNRKGEPVEYPKEVPYFVLPPELHEVLKDANGRGPKELKVAFPVDDIQAVFDPWYKLYQGPFLKVKCDGVTAQVFERGEFVPKACQLPESGTVCPCGAKAQARLHVLVHGAPSVGVYQVLIGGHERIAQLTKQLILARRLFGSLTHDQHGRVLWHKLVRIESHAQAVKQDGNQVLQTGYPVHLLPDVPTAVALQMSDDALAALPPATSTTEEPDDVVPDAPDVEKAGDTAKGEVIDVPHQNTVGGPAAKPVALAEGPVPGLVIEGQAEDVTPREADRGPENAAATPPSKERPKSGDEPGPGDVHDYTEALVKDAGARGLPVEVFRAYLKAVWSSTINEDRGADINALLDESTRSPAARVAFVKAMKLKVQKVGAA